MSGSPETYLFRHAWCLNHDGGLYIVYTAHQIFIIQILLPFKKSVLVFLFGPFYLA